MRPDASLTDRIRRFASPTALGMVMPLVLLPVLARYGTSVEWVSLAVGQGIGAVAGLAVNVGWSLAGPSLVAAAESEARARMYRRSLRTRLAAYALFAPLAVLASTAAAPSGGAALAAGTSAAVAMTGLLPTWFNVGAGLPRALVAFDVLPALTATIAGSVVIATGGSVLWYPALLGVGFALSVLAFSVKTLSRSSPERVGYPDEPGGRALVTATLTEVAGAMYSSATVALVSVVASVTAVATYTSGWRLYQVGLLGVVVLTQSLQGWVAENSDHVRARLVWAIRLHITAGVVAGACLATLGTLVSGVLFGEDLRATPVTCSALGVALAAVCLNSALGRLVLVSGRRYRTILHSTLGGAVVGLPLMLVLASRWGSEGAAVSLAVSELVVCAWQLPGARTALTAPSSMPPAAHPESP